MHARRLKPCNPQIDAFDYTDLSPYEIDVDADEAADVT